MKILHIIPYFYPAWTYGGTPRVVFDLCRELVNQGHDVTVYTTDSLDKKDRIKKAFSYQESAISGQRSAISDQLSAVSHQNSALHTCAPKRAPMRRRTPHSALYFDAEVEGIKVRYFRNVSNYLAFTQKLFLTPGFSSSLRDVLKNTDIVHLQEYRTLQNVSAWKTCREGKIPYVLSAHGAILSIAGRERRKELFDRVFGHNILRDAKKLIAVSELEKRQYQEFGIEEEKIEIVPNGINLSQFDSLPEKGSFRKKYNLDDRSVILFLGRIHRIKGIDILIDAFAELRREGIECKLIIAGPDDGFKRECGMRIADCGLKQIDLSTGEEMGKKEVSRADVIFTGLVSGEEKLSLLVDADVTVLPSRFEIFSLVLFESLMCGTPIVVSETCGVASMIHEAGVGYIIKAEDRKDLKERIQEVLDNSEKAKFSVERGRMLIKERLNLNTVTQRMIYIYKSCLS